MLFPSGFRKNTKSKKAINKLRRKTKNETNQINRYQSEWVADIVPPLLETPTCKASPRSCSEPFRE
jgi:hypothetical protein